MKVEASMVVLLIGKFERNAHCLLRGRAWRKMRRPYVTSGGQGEPPPPVFFVYHRQRRPHFTRYFGGDKSSREPLGIGFPGALAFPIGRLPEIIFSSQRGNPAWQRYR